jgi:AraC-like DNA-binding protein
MAQIAVLSESVPHDDCYLKLATGQPVDPTNTSCLKCLDRQRAFYEWLRLPVLAKRADLEAYLDLAVPTLQFYPVQRSTTVLRVLEGRRPALRCDVRGCSAPTSPCYPAANKGREKSGSREGVWRISCRGPISRSAGSSDERVSRCCPNRFSLHHYLPFVPEWNRLSAHKLFVWNLRALLGVIRAERCSFLDGRVSISPVKAAVRAVQQTRGSVQMCLKTLSRELHLSTSYMAVLFTRTVGLNFRQYLRSVRLVYAAELLLNSRAKIADISAALGYTEPSNFVREVRVELDACPTRLRSIYSCKSLSWACPLNLHRLKGATAD